MCEGLLDALSERDDCYWPLRPYRYPGLDMVFIGARVRLLAVSYNCIQYVFVPRLYLLEYMYIA